MDDTIRALCNKLTAENARNRTAQVPSPPVSAPPPYMDSDNDSDDEDDEDEDSRPLPMKLLINAAHFLEGSGNIVPITSSPLSDATKFSALLLTAINQINGASHLAAKRPIKLDLTINCGITIHGDRNVIGNVGVRPRPTNPVGPVAGPARATESAPRPAMTAGAKRKAEEVRGHLYSHIVDAHALLTRGQSSDASSEPLTKKIAGDDVD